MSLKLFTCGDIVNFQGKKDFIDDQLKSVIKSSDISICNFEAPIKINNMKAIKKVGPHIYQSPKSIRYLKDCGFNAVSLANNHIYDYGHEALHETIEKLKKHSIKHVGAGDDFMEAYQTTIINKKGIKIGLIAGCDNEFGCLFEKKNRGGYAWLFHHMIEDNIRELKPIVDSVVLIAHAGVENINMPIKEWRDRYKRLCDIGVDVIIGHHPHVPQGYEKHNKALIFYSLGNFYFDTVGFEFKSDDSYSVVIEFEKQGIKDFEIIYHKKIDGRTCKVKKEDINFSFKNLNYLLENDYEKRNNEICVELFHKYYYSYYEMALGALPLNRRLKQLIKYIIKKMLLMDIQLISRNLWLLHNIRIDTHRFVVQRALSLKSEKRE